jgi:hypothetical protein
VRTLVVAIVVACLGTASLAFGHGSSNKLPVPGQRYHAVTQATLGSTVCVSGYTSTIRPPVSYTSALKRWLLKDRQLPARQRLRTRPRYSVGARWRPVFDVYRQTNSYARRSTSRTSGRRPAMPRVVLRRRQRGRLIASIAPLYLTGSVLDVTYGGGAWWRRFTPEPFGVTTTSSRTAWTSARCRTSTTPGTPCASTRRTSRAARWRRARARDRPASAYGLTVRRSRAELEALIAEGLAECARVARQWVLAKCCDYAENPEVFRLGHVTTIVAGEKAGLRVHDLIVHAGGSGPSNARLRTVRRTRRAHSYLIVFVKRGGSKP